MSRWEEDLERRAARGDKVAAVKFVDSLVGQPRGSSEALDEADLYEFKGSFSCDASDAEVDVGPQEVAGGDHVGVAVSIHSASDAYARLTHGAWPRPDRRLRVYFRVHVTPRLTLAVVGVTVQDGVLMLADQPTNRTFGIHRRAWEELIEEPLYGFFRDAGGLKRFRELQLAHFFRLARADRDETLERLARDEASLAKLALALVQTREAGGA